MKNSMKTFVACLALGLGLSGCYDEMDSKASIDAQYAKSCEASVSLGEVSALSFSEVEVAASVSDITGVLEVGFMLSSSEDFQTYTTYPSKELTTSLGTAISGLSELTTYYVRGYAYTIDGTKVSETKSVTTPAAPIYELSGEYMAVDYNADDGAPGDPYAVTVAFAEGSETDILITNLWGGELTITAKYDPATGKLSIPTQQNIYLHASYGDVWIEEENGGPAIEGQFTAKGGFLNINTFYAICGAGSFGAQYVRMTHK